MGLSRTRNMQDLKVPTKRFALKASGKGSKTEESETPKAGSAKSMKPASDPGTPSRGKFVAAEAATDRNPPRSGKPPPAARTAPTAEHARKISGAMNRGRQLP